MSTYCGLFSLDISLAYYSKMIVECRIIPQVLFSRRKLNIKCVEEIEIEGVVKCHYS